MFVAHDSRRIPDEGLVPSVLWWERAPSGGGPVSYADWSGPEPPRVLGVEDLPAIRDSGAAFCRKVEPGRSDPLLDALDRVARVEAPLA